jgi:predicted thioesterase
VDEDRLLGAEASVGVTVGRDMTAASMGSGDVDVLGTPAVLALVERAAVAALRGLLPDDRTSVGAWVELEHVAPSAVGTRVRAHARLQSVEDRRLTFTFQVADRAGMVARGSHVRIIVDRDAFQRSADGRTGSGDSGDALPSSAPQAR